MTVNRDQVVDLGCSVSLFPFPIVELRIVRRLAQVQQVLADELFGNGTSINQRQIGLSFELNRVEIAQRKLKAYIDKDVLGLLGVASCPERNPSSGGVAYPSDDARIGWLPTYLSSQ